MPGTNDKTTVSIINDNIAAPPADKAQVRVIHASPDSGEVDIVEKSGNKKLQALMIEDQWQELPSPGTEAADLCGSTDQEDPRRSGKQRMARSE